MNRTEFIAVTAVILFAAFVLGWFTYWLLHRFTRITQSQMNEVDAMAHDLHDAEEARDQAITYAQQREAELTNKLAQCEAELRAAMDGLRAARNETEDLRARLEAALSRSA
jgi:predicted  nucleic acid-binding Zn-ribbon protein